MAGMSAAPAEFIQIALPMNFSSQRKNLFLFF